MGGAPEAVIFDLGGVLIEWDPRAAYRERFPGRAARIDAFLEGPFREVALRSCEVDLPLAELAWRFADAHPSHREYLEFFALGWPSFVRAPMAESVALLERLRSADRALYALTNWPAETFPPPGPEYRFLDAFADVVVSGRTGMRKPGRGIFELALSRFRVEPAGALYIDDHEGNVVAARDVGLDAHHFRNAAGLERYLRGRGALRSLTRARS